MSLRKFTGLPFGGWVNIKKNDEKKDDYKITKNEKKVFQQFKEKKLYFQNKSKFSLKLENKFLKLNKKNEIFLDKNISNYSIPKICSNIINSFNWKAIREKRIENWHYLNKHLKKDFEIFPKKIQNNFCPLYFIIITKKRNEIRNHLISKRIFVASPWKKIDDFKYTKIKRSNYLYNNILYIPLDQRLEKFHLNIIIQNLLYYG